MITRRKLLATLAAAAGLTHPIIYGASDAKSYIICPWSRLSSLPGPLSSGPF